jgi:hypothetical protein
MVKRIDKKKLDLGLYILIGLGLLLFIILVISNKEAANITDSYVHYGIFTRLVYGDIKNETASAMNKHYSIFTYLCLIESLIQTTWSIVYLVYYTKLKGNKWYIAIGTLGIIVNTVILSALCAMFHINI